MPKTEEPKPTEKPDDPDPTVEVLPSTGQGPSDGNGTMTMLLLGLTGSLFMLGAWVLSRRSLITRS